ncbi:MAG: RCC1 domain-containing protein [Gaiellales bacterium]
MRALRLTLLALGLLAIGAIGAGCGNLIGVGGGVSCVVQANGAPNCFGANGAGQAGHATGVTPAAPGSVALPNGFGTVEVSAGEGSANGLATVCAVAGKKGSQSGQVYCWGDDAGGLLGRGSAGAASAVPVKVALGAGASASGVSVGGTLACAIVSGAASGVSCWGTPLGAGISAPAAVPGTAEFKSGDGTMSTPSLLAVGQSHACAGVAASLVCWGAGTSGQLGNAASADSAAPVAVALPKTVEGVGEVAAGGASTCVVATEKTGSKPQSIWCWGAIVAADVPTRVELPGGLEASHVSVGLAHACAVANDGTVWCWGANESGQLGNGTQAASATPVRVAGFTATLVGAGQDQSCASDRGGHLRCWGANTQGQLGRTGTSLSATALTVPGIAGLRAPAPKKATAKGAAAVGSTLTATTAAWPYAAGYTYQWQRRDSKGDWVDIPKASQQKLRVRASLAGAAVRVSITGTNAWTEAGVVFADSRASAARTIAG